MKRWWLALALILSLGINVGILATLALRRPAPPVDSPWSPPVDPLADPLADRPADPPTDPQDDPRHAILLERLVERLGLEGEERERFLAIQQRFFASQRGMRGQLGDLHRQLRSEVTADPPDAGKLEALLTELHRLQFERDRAWVESILESRQVLNPEQEQQYLRFVAFITRRALDERLHDGPRGPGGLGGRRRALRPEQ